MASTFARIKQRFVARKARRLFTSNYTKVVQEAIGLGYAENDVDADAWLARMLDIVDHHQVKPCFILVAKDYAAMADQAIEFEDQVKAMIAGKDRIARHPLDLEQQAILQRIKKFIQGGEMV